MLKLKILIFILLNHFNAFADSPDSWCKDFNEIDLFRDTIIGNVKELQRISYLDNGANNSLLKITYNSKSKPVKFIEKIERRNIDSDAIYEYDVKGNLVKFTMNSKINDDLNRYIYSIRYTNEDYRIINEIKYNLKRNEIDNRTYVERTFLLPNNIKRKICINMNNKNFNSITDFNTKFNIHFSSFNFSLPEKSNTIDDAINILKNIERTIPSLEPEYYRTPDYGAPDVYNFSNDGYEITSLGSGGKAFFDKNGNCLLEEFPDHTRVAKYKFDKIGNWTEELVEITKGENIGKKFVTKQKIEYWK